jgi:small GTP-binding protein
MTFESQIPHYKVVVLGNSGCGKTSIITVIRKLPFVPHAQQTVGAGSWQVQRAVDGETGTIEIWDTAGQDAFASLVPFYTRQAVVALFTFSLAEEGTLDSIPGWVNLINEREKIPVFLLVGNMADRERTVTDDAANEMAKSIGASCFETSAKDGRGIEDLTAGIIRAIRRVRAEAGPPASASVLLDGSLANRKQEAKCC